MRKFPALLSMIVLALLLVACGSDDDDSEPTAAPVEVTPPTEATEPAPATIASTAASSLATPGTPVIGATPVASPVAIASPVSEATPGAGTSAVALPGGTDDTTGGTAEGMQVLNGTVSLPGVINEAFVIADDGCVGLGRYAGVEAGQQVVVRNGQGAIVAVTELAAMESSVVCGWTFTAEAPESNYYAVSIPMVQERVFAGEDVAASNGQIELELP
ncbi:MAG: hypothetical protein M3457_17430 [Chloroflexota bacterium]|nr:hypothetical protein [Chloroflexota bacterium]